MLLLRVFLQLIFVGVYCAALGQQSDAKSVYDNGVRYQEENKLDSAIIFFERARDLYAAQNDHLEEARSISRLGDIYKYYTYNFDKAEKYYEQALSIFTTRYPDEEFRITRLYYNLAATNRSQRDYRTSVTWCQKAIDGCIRLKDNAFLERAYSIMGNIYRDMQLYDSAISYYQRGVDINKQLNKGKDNETLAGFYVGWGEAYYKQNKFAEADKFLTQAYRIYEKNEVADKLMLFHVVRLKAELSNRIGNPSTLYFDEGQRLLTDLKIERGGPPSALFKTFGDYHLALNQYDSAAVWYQRSLQATTLQPLGANKNPDNLDQVDFKGYAYDVLLAKANLMALQDSLRKAIECYALAEKLLIAGRNELDTEDAKWNFVDANFDLYETTLRLLYAKARPEVESALHFIESSKSLSLADALRQAEIKKSIGGNDTLFSKLQGLRQRSLSLQHQIAQKDESSVRDELIAIGREISDVEAWINQKYPAYLQTKYETNRVSLSVLQKKLKDVDAAFIEYFWGSRNSFVLIATADTAAFYRVDILPWMRRDMYDLQSMLTSRENKYSPADVAKFAKASNNLYRYFLKPYEKVFLGKKRLVIVPDGPLAQVPFETLVTKLDSGATYNRLAYLVNDYIVSYGFSGQYIVGGNKEPRTNPSMLAFGFTDASDVRSPGDVIASLQIPGSEAELNALSEKFPDGTYLYGSDVTERKFKEQAGNYDLLHLAVHGSGDPKEDYSATLYFRDADGSEDGRLYWYELYGMSLQASLAVLSACESGIGKTYRGEGMLSMASAFTFAGCSNVVMGLWKVDDQVSVTLMDTFYSELLGGVATDEALATAKRTYLASADQVSANPKLWSSLVAYGESPILKPGLHIGWFFLAMAVLISAVVLLYIKTKK